MKKVPLILLGLGFLLLIRQLLTGQLISGDDSVLHGARVASYYLALKQGQLPPTWGPNLNHGFGYPVFIFAYPLPNMISSLFFMLGLSVEWSLNLFVVVMLGLAALGAFFLAKTNRLDDWAASVVALTYVSSTYFLLNVFVRMAVGEIGFMGFLPWVILIFQQRKKIIKPWQWLVAWILMVGWLLAHPLLLIVAIPLLAMWLWQDGFLKELSAEPIKKSTWCFVGLVISSGLTIMFSWLPLVLEKKFTRFNTSSLISNYQDRFLSLSDLIYRPWGFGGMGGLIGKDSFPTTVGIILWLIVLVGAYVFFKKKEKGLQLKFWLITFGISILLMLPISKTLWRVITILPLLMFPWRLLWVSTLASLMILIILLKNKFLRKPLLVILVGVSFYKLIFYAKPIGFVSNSPHEWLEYSGSTATVDEHLSKWWNQQQNLRMVETVAMKKHDQPLLNSANELVGQIGQAKLISKKGKTSTYLVKTDEPAKVILKTMYFPGWRAWVNQQRVKIDYQDPEFPGRITINVAAGESIIKVKYTNLTFARIIGMILTILGIGLSSLILLNWDSFNQRGLISQWLERKQK